MVQAKSIKKTKQFLVASLIPLLCPFYMITVWIYVVEKTSTHDQRVALFDSFFPSLLQNSYYTIGLALLCCIVSFMLSFMSLPTHNKWLQTLALVIMAIASIIGMWFLFTLM